MRWSRDFTKEQITFMEKLYRCSWMSSTEKGFVRSAINRGEYGELAQRRLNRLAKHYQYHKQSEYDANNI